MKNPTVKTGLMTCTHFSLAGAFVMLLLPMVVVADNCAYEETLNFTLDANDVARVDIQAGAGSLDVHGDSADDQIHVQALVCASRKSGLEGMGVEHVLRNGIQSIATRIPESATMFWTNTYSHINLTVHLPQGLPVQITDGSGSMSVTGTGELVIQDGSGNIAIDSVAGNVEVRDGSGELNIANVAGNVEVRDGSGSLFIAAVDGTVSIHDGSGSIDVRDVSMEVTILESGSGSVALQRVNTVAQIAAE